MNRRTFLKAGCFLILALVMFSCTNTSLDPVFYALEQEKSLVDDRGFPDDAVVQRIVKDSANNRYFAAASNLRQRDATSSSNWSRIAAPVSGALCTNVEIFATNLVAAYLAAGNSGLYYRNVDLSDSWTLVSSLPVNAQVGLLRNIDNNNTDLFVSTLSGSTYSLYHCTNLTFPNFTATNLTATMTTGPISDIAWDGINYWVSVGSTLWSGTTALSDFAAYAGVDKPTTARPFGGLFRSSTGTIYLAADGKFYARTGGVWTASSSITVESDRVQFTNFVEIPAPPLATADVYAGTKGYGYYVTSSMTRSPSYTISGLFDGAILSMLYDGSTSPKSLLLGTYSSGLWRGDWDAGLADWVWKQE